MFSRRILVTCWLALAAIAIACVAAFFIWHQLQRVQNFAKLKESFGGGEGLLVIQQPEKEEAFRLDDSRDQKSLDELQVVGDPVRVESATATEFARLLTDDRSYFWTSGAKGCLPVYGVKLRFTRRDSTIDVIFCFHCDVLTVFREGGPVGSANFDYSHKELARLFKPLFPNDQAIQAID